MTQGRKGLSDIFLIVTFGLFIAGTSKAAMMPFHAWLPRAMVAPTPVSAFLHAVAVVKSGIFIVVKIVLHLFGINLLKELRLGIVLAYCASVTMIVSSVIALRQDNLKARLAYSTVCSTFICNIRCRPSYALRYNRKYYAYSNSCIWQDNALFLCRGYLCCDS